MNKEIIWKAVKEPLRLLVLAIVPFAITFFTEIDTQWAIGATVVLRFADKFLHEIGKEKSTKKAESKLVKGIVRF
jgi:hypothetical protein